MKIDGSGLRYDTGKTRFDLVPVFIINALGDIYTIGAQKYADWNWAKGMKWSRIYASLLRHLFKFMCGERLDPESGKPHLAHALWNVGTLLYYSEVPGYESFDDRVYAKGSDRTGAEAALQTFYVSSEERPSTQIVPPQG